MASGEVYDAIVGHLADQWTTTPVRYENKNFNYPDGPWVDIETTGNYYGQESIGESEQENNRWDEDGVLYVHVLVPQGTGASLARTYAKQLADIFRGVTLLGDSLEFRDAFIGRGEPGAEDGNWYRISVYIDWRRMDA